MDINLKDKHKIDILSVQALATCGLFLLLGFLYIISPEHYTSVRNTCLSLIADKTSVQVAVQMISQKVESDIVVHILEQTPPTKDAATVPTPPKENSGVQIDFAVTDNTAPIVTKMDITEDQLVPVKGAGGEYAADISEADIKSRKPPAGATFSPVVVTVKPIWPVSGTISSLFGYRKHPITKKDDFHTGLDIAAPMDTTIYAAYPGTIVETGQSSGYGNYIVMQHSGNVKTTYSHLNSILVKSGVVIRQGERIGLVGSTGVSTGPHLHFEVLVDSILVNPLWILDSL